MPADPAQNETPLIRDFDDPAYDPYTANMVKAGTWAIGDVWPELRRLRQDSPVQELDLRVHLGTAPDLGMVGRKKFSILGYKEVSEVLGDPSRFSNKIYEPSLGVSFGRSVTVMDPPEHRKYRMIFQKAFTPGMIAGWGETIIPDCIGRVLDRITGQGKADIEHEFALIFPFAFISDLLKLPEKDRAIFQKLAFSQTTVRFDPDHGREGGAKLREYLIQLVAQRRSKPLGDSDFISTLVDAQVDGEILPEEILISFLRQLMNAGGDTSYHGFSSVVAALLRHPEQFEALKADRRLLRPAIDEGLRWEPPIMILDRTPVQEMEYCGHRISPGDHLGIVIAAANRDEAVFENPDEFDIFRKPARHLAFGYGPHICIGQHLARMELSAALSLVMDRLPNLRLDPDYPAPQVYGVTTRKPREVRVLWDV